MNVTIRSRSWSRTVGNVDRDQAQATVHNSAASAVNGIEPHLDNQEQPSECICPDQCEFFWEVPVGVPRQAWWLAHFGFLAERAPRRVRFG